MSVKRKSRQLLYDCLRRSFLLGVLLSFGGSIQAMEGQPVSQAQYEELLKITLQQQKVIEKLQQSVANLTQQLDQLVGQALQPSNGGNIVRPQSDGNKVQHPVSSIVAEADARDQSSSSLSMEHRSGHEDKNAFEFSGYHIFTYHDFDWETDPARKNRTDLERSIWEVEYQFSDWIKLEAEIEIEHGGTGSTMEFDVFEEFGEFEQEVEQGGEVVVEKLQAELLLQPEVNVKLGHIVLPVGLLNLRHKPSDYFTTTRSESENVLLPNVWHENGVGLFGRWQLSDTDYLKYQLQVVSGLDSTGFSSGSWIKGGYQKRFEFKVAEDFAYVFNLNYHHANDLMLGVSAYYGNTSGNRPKGDVDFDSHVGIYTVHGTYEPGLFKLRAQYLYGELENSDLLSKANSYLSNKLGVKRTPVAHSAEAWFVEAGYDIASLFSLDQSFSVFARYDEYDTMKSVEGLIFDNPRWQKESWTVGFNYHLYPNFIWKMQQSWRDLGSEDINQENTFSTSLSIEY